MFIIFFISVNEKINIKFYMIDLKAIMNEIITTININKILFVTIIHSSLLFNINKNFSTNNIIYK